MTATEKERELRRLKDERAELCGQISDMELRLNGISIEVAQLEAELREGEA